MMTQKTYSIYHKMTSVIMTVIMLLSATMPVSAQTVLDLPPPGQMVSISANVQPPILKGVKIYADNPFKFEFILNKGDWKSSAEELQFHAKRLIKYFMAALTVPENDLWVNLSPYEKDRIITNEFGQTELGRDMLAQDYILKQLTASIIYPETDSGKRFWGQVYKNAFELYGTTDIPVDTFNKVWIVPETADVYEKANVENQTAVVYVVGARLKVMLESDYLARQNNLVPGTDNNVEGAEKLAKNILREVIIPLLEKEVNEGANFAKLRQVYYSLILAAWYKNKVKASLLSSVYVDQKKVSGVNIDDPKMAEKIWGQYVEAFKKGAYNYIKEEHDQLTGETIPRKYFSGGFDAAMVSRLIRPVSGIPEEEYGNDVILRTLLEAASGQGGDFVKGVGGLQPVKAPSGYVEESGLYVRPKELATVEKKKSAVQVTAEREIRGYLQKIRQGHQGLDLDEMRNLSSLAGLLEPEQKKEISDSFLALLRWQVNLPDGERLMLARTPEWREQAYRLLSNIAPEDMRKEDHFVYTLLRSIKEFWGDEYTSAGREFLDNIAGQLAALSEASYQEYLDILSRIPLKYDADGIAGLPKDMTFGIELEIAVMSGAGVTQVDDARTLALRRDLVLALEHIIGDSGFGWVVKTDLDNIEINTPTLTNDRKGFARLQEGLTIAQDIIKRYMQKLPAGYTVATGMHIHGGAPGKDLKKAAPAVTFIGKSLEYFWAALSATRSILPVAMPMTALYGDGDTGKNRTFIYLSQHDTFAFNAFDTVNWNSPNYFEKIQMSVGVVLNVVHQTVENPEQFRLDNWRRPVLEGSFYTEDIADALRTGLDLLYGDNIQGKNAFLRLLLTKGWRPKITSVESLFKGKNEQERRDTLVNLYFSYVTSPGEWRKVLARLLMNNLIEESWMVPYGDKNVLAASGDFLFYHEGNKNVIESISTGARLFEGAGVSNFEPFGDGKVLGVTNPEGGWDLWDVEQKAFVGKRPNLTIQELRALPGGNFIAVKYFGMRWGIWDIKKRIFVEDKFGKRIWHVSNLPGSGDLVALQYGEDDWGLLRTSTGEFVGQWSGEDIKDFVSVRGSDLVGVQYPRGDWRVWDTNRLDFVHDLTGKSIIELKNFGDISVVGVLFQDGWGLWSNERKVFITEHHENKVVYMQGLYNGKFISLRYSDASWQLWDVERNDFVSTSFAGAIYIKELPGGKLIGVRTRDGWNIFDAERREIVAAESAAIKELYDLHSRRWLAVIDKEGGLGLLDVEQRKFISVVNNDPRGKVKDVKGLLGGDMVGVKFEDAWGIWDVKNAKFLVEGKDIVRDFFDVPGGKWVGVEYEGSRWELWDAGTGVREVFVNTPFRNGQFASFPDGSYMIAGVTIKSVGDLLERGSQGADKDSAQITNPGGIDLNGVDKRLRVSSRMAEIKFRIDPAMLERYKTAPGFVPVIINVDSKANIRAFLM